MVESLPPGDGMAGVCFLPPVVDFLAAAAVEEGATEADFWGVSFLLVDLLGVYLRTLSTLLLAPVSAFLAGAALFSLAADFEAALVFLLAPPLTLAWAGADGSSSLLRASLPFSWIKMSWILRT